MNRILISFLLLSSSLAGTSQTIEELRSQWEEKWPGLQIPALQLAYNDFLNQHLSSRNLKEQTAFFQSIDTHLERIQPKQLSSKDRLDWRILRYETDLNLQRLQLIKNTKGKFRQVGIFNGPNGPAWYTYLIKHWTSADISPEEVTNYGWAEIDRIKLAIRTLKAQHQIKRDHTQDKEVVEMAFQAYEKFLEERVWSVVPHWFTPDLTIRNGTNPNLRQVPGYYGGNVLSYNLFDEPFDLSQIDWLYLHEGVPGHHFQLNSERRVKVPAFRMRMSYSGFREGWAAYVEELAHERNWYSGPAQRLSQMEWDLIRSIRLVLDVGLNHEGWSDDKAMQVWRSVLSGSDHIAEREIGRMRRWPAQVLTYKIGTRIILKAREEALGTDRTESALKAFHSKLLSNASIPMALVPQLFDIDNF